MTPTTGYAAPQILDIVGFGAVNASTQGGDAVDIIGVNFGVIADAGIDSVMYGSDDQSSGLFAAVGCSVVVDYTRVRCQTAPGVKLSVWCATEYPRTGSRLLEMPTPLPHAQLLQSLHFPLLLAFFVNLLVL